MRLGKRVGMKIAKEKWKGCDDLDGCLNWTEMTGSEGCPLQTSLRVEQQPMTTTLAGCSGSRQRRHGGGLDRGSFKV